MTALQRNRELIAFCLSFFFFAFSIAFTVSATTETDETTVVDENIIVTTEESVVEQIAVEEVVAETEDTEENVIETQVEETGAAFVEVEEASQDQVEEASQATDSAVLYDFDNDITRICDPRTIDRIETNDQLDGSPEQEGIFYYTDGSTCTYGGYYPEIHGGTFEERMELFNESFAVCWITGGGDYCNDEPESLYNKTTIDGSVCQLYPGDDDVLIETGDFLRSDKDQASAEGSAIDVSIPSGKYNVTLQSYDDHLSKPGQVQPNESWYLKLSDGGGVFGQTSSISDLPDDEDYLIETVDTDFVVATDIKKVQAIHTAYPDSNPNSVRAVCALFEKVEDPEPEPEIGFCPLEEKDGRTIVDFSQNILRLRSDQTEDRAKEIFNVNIPAGTYDVTLVGADAYEKRVNVSQPNESYFLELFSGSTSTAFTGFLDDLLDNVVAATSTTLVNTDFVVSADVDSIATTHSVYPDTSSPNSVTPVCAAFDKKDGGGGNGPCIVPEFKSSSSIDTKVGEFVSYTITASSTTDATFSVATSSLPDGLTFDGVDTISGTTTTVGTFGVDVTISNACQDLDVNLTFNITEDTDDGGNGGGGNGNGGGTVTGGGSAGTSGRVLGAEIGICTPLLTEYLRLGQDNDPTQVRLLQAFLKGVEGYDVDVTGIFDERTDAAVRAFQLKYADDVLAPWGLEESTGYVYYTTQKKINEIYCGREFPLTNVQTEEIEMCLLAQSGEHFGIGGDPFGDQSQTGGQIGQATSTAVTLTLTDTTGDDELAVEEGNGESFLSATRDRVRDVATAAITFPQTPRDTVYYALWLILILALVYIIGSLVAGVRDSGLSDQVQLRTRKIMYFITGTLVGLIVVVFLKLTSLVVPLIVVIVALSIGLLYYSRKVAK